MKVGWSSRVTLVWTFLLLSLGGIIVPPALAAAAVTVGNFFFSPSAVSTAQGTTVTWTFTGSAPHTVTDRSGMGLFHSGTKSTGSFPFTFVAAAIYPYKCNIHSNMLGTVRVPVKAAPSSGTASTTFQITWSSATAPAGFVFDVQVKRPGAAAFVNWKTNQTARGANFKADAGVGTYSFRARLRKPSVSAFASWSPAKAITIN